MLNISIQFQFIVILFIFTFKFAIFNIHCHTNRDCILGGYCKKQEGYGKGICMCKSSIVSDYCDGLTEHCPAHLTDVDICNVNTYHRPNGTCSEIMGARYCYCTYQYQGLDCDMYDYFEYGHVVEGKWRKYHYRLYGKQNHSFILSI